MNLMCEMAAPFVANSAVEGGRVARPFRGHTDACLKCQARHTAMARTARQLRVIAGDKARAPADLEWRVMSSLEGDLAISRSWKRPVTVGAALLSMGAAFLIWRLRPRAST